MGAGVTPLIRLSSRGRRGEEGGEKAKPSSCSVVTLSDRVNDL